MILGAGLLVLLGLGLLIGGVITGVTALYWGCVAVCVVAAVLLFLVRRQIAATSESAAAEDRTDAEPVRDAEPEPEPAAVEPVAAEPRIEATARRESAAPAGSASVPVSVPATTSDGAEGAAEPDEPPLEEVEVTDLLLVVDLHDEVLVIDEHPRYHLAGCSYLAGRTTIPLPIDEARSDGFTPCGSCRPDSTLADRARARKAADS